MDETPQGRTVESLHESLVKLCVDGFRFARTFERAIDKLPITEQGRFISQVRFFVRSLEESLEPHGIKLVRYEGSHFDPGLPVHVVNADEVGDADNLIIDQTLEPAIVGPRSVIRMGSVLLRKKTEAS